MLNIRAEYIVTLSIATTDFVHCVSNFVIRFFLFLPLFYVLGRKNKESLARTSNAEAQVFSRACRIIPHLSREFISAN